MTDIIKDIKRVRKSPVPANADRITEGALKLDLKKRVELRNKLSTSIDNELKQLESDLAKAKELIK